MVKIRHRKRKTYTPKQQKNIADRLSVSTNIREELVLALDNKISGFRNIKWISKSKTYNTIKDIKFNLCMIILNEYNGHKKNHNIDKEYSSYSAVNCRKILGNNADKIMSMVFDIIHPSTTGETISLIEDKTTLKYKLKESAAKSAAPGTKNPGATLGPGPAAGPDGVADNAYIKQFKFQLVPKNKDGTYVQKGSGMIVKKLF